MYINIYFQERGCFICIKSFVMFINFKSSHDAEPARTRVFFNYMVDFIYNFNEIKTDLDKINDEVRKLFKI